MLSVRKRGRAFRVEGRVCGQYVRLSLGTRERDHAIRVKNRIESALVERYQPELWLELRRLLPPSAFQRLASLAGYVEQPERPIWRWAGLVESFSTEAAQRMAIGKLRETTWVRYRQTLKAFGAFLAEQQVQNLAQITRPVVEQFKAYRMASIREKKNARGGRGLALDVAILHRVFAHAVECEMIERNPVRLEGRPGENSEAGAQPFNAEQLAHLREAAGQDLLAFLLLRHTGFRGSDAVGLRWEEIDWEAREIHRLTQKRRKRVVMPIHTELLFALEAEWEKRRPRPDDHVLLNPVTGSRSHAPDSMRECLPSGNAQRLRTPIRIGSVTLSQWTYF